MNRQDRYWLLNDAEKLCDYLEDTISSLLSTSDKIGYTEMTNAPYGMDHLTWKVREYAAKSQDKMGSYLSHKMLSKKSSSGEIGVIETRPYEHKQLENKRPEQNRALQIQGREAMKDR